MDGRLLSSSKSYEASNKLDIGRFANEACTLNMSRNGKSSSWHIILL
jgi:hypothetical protein